MTDFSIIIPCYNAVETLRATLDSILAQTWSDWEVICIDDGSTDATLELLQQISARDSRIKMRDNPGKGPSSARNFGAMICACSDIIAFCDADDIWGVDKLSQLADCFGDDKVDAAFGQIAFFEDDPALATTLSTVPLEPLSIPMLLGENPVCTMSNIAVRSDAFLRSGGFDETLVHNEDLEWLIRLVGTGAHVVGIDICQTWYRTNPKGLSANLQAMQQGREGALETAALYGHLPSKATEAVFLRYLSRRALRLGHQRMQPFVFAAKGVLLSPLGFFNVPRRGLATFAGALLALALPKSASQKLFSR